MPLIRVSDSVYEWLNAVKNAKGLSSINDAIATLKNPNPGFPREVYSLTVTVPASTMITREENYIKFGEDVVITKVYVFFPDGCEDLLTVVLGAGSKEYAPKIISGDNKSLWIEPKLFVPAGTPIWAEIRNEDTTYPHTPTIEVEVEKIGEVGLV